MFFASTPTIDIEPVFLSHRPIRVWSVLALPIFPVRARYRRCRCGMPGAFRRQFCLTYRQQKTASFWMRSVLALPILPASRPASIVGEGVLNFCVRDGNRWTHTPINTNYLRYTLKTEHHNILRISVQTRVCAFVGQALGLLVSVSLTHYCAYTPDLSTT